MKPKKSLTKVFEITPCKLLAMASFTTLSCIYSFMLQHLSHSWALTHILPYTKKQTRGETKKCIKIVHL
jgi:hypothetical protein